MYVFDLYISIKYVLVEPFCVDDQLEEGKNSKFIAVNLIKF